MGPAEAREAALQLAPGCVRGQHLQPPHGPAGLLPVRPDADHRPPCRRHDRLCRATAPVGGRAVAGLARAVAAPIQGLRGATRGLRSYGHLGDDPPHAPSPRPPQPQAPACSVTSKTGFKNYVPQDIQAYFSRPSRSINHGRIKEIKDGLKHKATKAASHSELEAFLDAWPDVD